MTVAGYSLRYLSGPGMMIVRMFGWLDTNDVAQSMLI